MFRGKFISDGEWLGKAKPLYDAAVPLTMALNHAVARESIQDEMNAVVETYSKLSIIADRMERLPKPTSPATRLVDEKLKWAMKLYVGGLKEGRLFLNDLREESTSRLDAAGLAWQKECFEGFIKQARKHMKEADAYFFSIGENF